MPEEPLSPQHIQVYLGPEGSLEPISLAPGSTFTWGVSYGVFPYVAELELLTPSAERVFASSLFQGGYPEGESNQISVSGPLMLKIVPTYGEELVFKGLWVLEKRPVSATTQALLIADGRWRWTRPLSVRNYNIRRATGSNRLVGGALVPNQLQQVQADYAFRRSSIVTENEAPGGRPYRPLEILEDQLTEVSGPETFEIDPAKILRQDTQDGIEILDKGAAGLSRALDLFSGLEVFQDYDSKIRLGNRYDGTEVIVEELGPPNSGFHGLVSKSRVRWRKARVYFQKEHELRFDLVADLFRQTVQLGREPLVIQNVIPWPLYEFVGPNGRAYTFGDLLTVPEFLEAYNAYRASTGFTYVESAPLTKDVIDREWLGNWIVLDLRALVPSSASSDQSVAILHDAIRSHYLATYQVLTQWADKIRSLIPVRAAILNPETGARAKASVFADYLAKLTAVGISPVNGAKSSSFVPFPSGDLAQAVLSPFDVEILDNDQGVFRVVPALDQQGTASEYVVGRPLGELPRVDMAAKVIAWSEVTLQPTANLSVIMTALQDAPNNKGRLHCHEVTISEAAEALGVDAPDLSVGPDIEIFVPTDTARFGWVDAQAEQIKEAFFDGKPAPPSLLINAQEIRDQAVAAAANELVPYLDKLGGVALYAHTRQISPTGNLRSVETQIQDLGDGKATVGTITRMANELERPGQDALTEDATRRVIRRQVVL